MTTIVYGIPNCDTVRKARRWLDAHGVEYEFHDYKKKGIDAATLKLWSKDVGWEALLNRRGTTWRKLSDDDKEQVTAAGAIKLMQAHTSLIKRPVVEHGGVRLVGFDEGRFGEVFV